MQHVAGKTTPLFELTIALDVLLSLGEIHIDQDGFRDVIPHHAKYLVEMLINEGIQMSEEEVLNAAHVPDNRSFTIDNLDSAHMHFTSTPVPTEDVGICIALCHHQANNISVRGQFFVVLLDGYSGEIIRNDKHFIEHSQLSVVTAAEKDWFDASAPSAARIMVFGGVGWRSSNACGK